MSATVSSNFATDILERKTRVLTQLRVTNSLGRDNSPNYFTEFALLLDLCTSDISTLKPQDKFATRILFEVAEHALGEMQITARHRLGLTEFPPPNVDNIEQTLHTRHEVEIESEESQAQIDRHTCLKEKLLELQGMQSDDPNIFTVGMELVRLAMYDEDRITFDGGLTTYPPSLSQEQIVDLQVWNRTMFEYVAIAMVFMAGCLSSLFRNQSIYVHGKKVPVSCFDTFG